MSDSAEEAVEGAPFSGPENELEETQPPSTDIPLPESVPAGGDAEAQAPTYSELVAELRKLTKRLEKKDRHLKSLLDQRNDLHHQLRAAQDTAAGLEAQLQEGQAQNEAAAAAQLEPYEETIRQLCAERDAAHNRLQELETKLAESQTANEAASQREARLQELEAGLAARAQALEEACRARDELNRRVVALEQDLEQARTSPQELGHAREEAQHALALAVEADETRQRAEKRAATLEAELAEARQALVERLQQEAAASAPQPAPVAGVLDSVDLTGEWEQTLAASPEMPESTPSQAAQPFEVEGSMPALPAAPPEEEPSEAITVEVLPVPEEARAEPPAEQAATEPPERAKKLILVAEDDPAIRRLVEIALQKSGLEVITAEDGEEAFQKAITERPNAILTDILMPRMNGLELTSRLKKTPSTARIPIGFLTAQRELEYYKEALELGSTLYITKPFRPDNLVTMVNLLLSGKRKPRLGRK